MYNVYNIDIVADRDRLNVCRYTLRGVFQQIVLNGSLFKVTFEISEESKNGSKKKQAEDGDHRRERGERQRDHPRDPGERRHRSALFSLDLDRLFVKDYPRNADDDERREKRRSSKQEPDNDDQDHHERSREGRSHHSSSESRKHERHSESRKSQGKISHQK